MILVGMFDSPFVRRVAISMAHMDLPFEHRDWSVGKDFEKIRQYNPLGRVPVLVLDDGQALFESAMILDHLDRQAGFGKALLPRDGDARREALQVMALATGAVDKGMQLVYEQAFRPADKQHAPWTDRCRGQMEAAMDALDRHCGGVAGRKWLVGNAMTQADITLACFATYLSEAVALDMDRWPRLRDRVAHCESLPVFEQYRVAFHPPVPTLWGVQ